MRLGLTWAYSPWVGHLLNLTARIIQLEFCAPVFDVLKPVWKAMSKEAKINPVPRHVGVRDSRDVKSGAAPEGVENCFASCNSTDCFPTVQSKHRSKSTNLSRRSMLACAENIFRQMMPLRLIRFFIAFAPKRLMTNWTCTNSAARSITWLSAEVFSAIANLLARGKMKVS